MLRPYGRPFSIPCVPSAHVASVVEPDIREPHLAEQFRDLRAARCLGAGRRRCGGERGLARQGPLVGALDVTSGYIKL